MFYSFCLSVKSVPKIPQSLAPASKPIEIHDVNLIAESLVFYLGHLGVNFIFSPLLK